MQKGNYAWYTPPRKIFILVVKSTPQLQSLGILFKKDKIDNSCRQQREKFPKWFYLAQIFDTNNELLIQISWSEDYR